MLHLSLMLLGRHARLGAELHPLGRRPPNMRWSLVPWAWANPTVWWGSRHMCEQSWGWILLGANPLKTQGSLSQVLLLSLIVVQMSFPSTLTHSFEPFSDATHKTSLAIVTSLPIARGPWPVKCWSHALSTVDIHLQTIPIGMSQWMQSYIRGSSVWALPSERQVTGWLTHNELHNYKERFPLYPHPTLGRGNREQNT